VGGHPRQGGQLPVHGAGRLYTAPAAFRRRPDARTDLLERLVQSLRVGNDAPGNSGFVLYVDILLPIIGFVLVRLSRRHPVPVSAPNKAGRDAEAQTAEG
jgi:hypothetical protein